MGIKFGNATLPKAEERRRRKLVRSAAAALSQFDSGIIGRLHTALQDSKLQLGPDGATEDIGYYDYRPVTLLFACFISFQR